MINSLNLDESVYEIKESLIGSGWQHYFLKNDSVYLSYLSFKLKNSPCLSGIDSSNNTVFLTFADDKLYKLSLSVWYKPADLSKCLTDYHRIFDSAKLGFPVWQEFVTKQVTANEQTGEGYFLYKNMVDTKEMKFERLELGYLLEYEYKYNQTYTEKYKTGNVKEYKLKITLVNLKNTKLDRRNY